MSRSTKSIAMELEEENETRQPKIPKASKRRYFERSGSLRDSFRSEEEPEPKRFSGRETVGRKDTASYRETDAQRKHTQVYIGNMPFTADQNDLKQLLAYFDFKNLRIFGDWNRDKKRFAFVDFVTLKEADRCISEMDQREFHGRKLMVRYASNQRKVTDIEGGVCFNCGKSGHFKRECPITDGSGKIRHVYIGNFPSTADQSDLEQLLVDFDCKNLRIFDDKNQDKKRFAFVAFTSRKEADRCISEMDQTVFQGHNLKVRYADLEPNNEGPAKKQERDWNTEYANVLERVKNQSIIKSNRKSRFSTVFSAISRNCPLIGLQWVTEYQKPDETEAPWYLCFMCQCKIEWKPILNHVISKQHRLNYMMRSYPSLFSRLKRTKGKDTSNMKEAVKEYSLKISKIEKEQNMEVMLEMNCNKSLVAAAKKKSRWGALPATVTTSSAPVNQQQLQKMAVSTSQRTAFSAGEEALYKAQLEAQALLSGFKPQLPVQADFTQQIFKPVGPASGFSTEQTLPGRPVLQTQNIPLSTAMPRVSVSSGTSASILPPNAELGISVPFPSGQINAPVSSIPPPFGQTLGTPSGPFIPPPSGPFIPPPSEPFILPPAGPFIPPPPGLFVPPFLRGPMDPPAVQPTVPEFPGSDYNWVRPSLPPTVPGPVMSPSANKLNVGIPKTEVRAGYDNYDNIPMDEENIASHVSPRGSPDIFDYNHGRQETAQEIGDLESMERQMLEADLKLGALGDRRERSDYRDENTIYARQSRFSDRNESDFRISKEHGRSRSRSPQSRSRYDDGRSEHSLIASSQDRYSDGQRDRFRTPSLSGVKGWHHMEENDGSYEDSGYDRESYSQSLTDSIQQHITQPLLRDDPGDITPVYIGNFPKTADQSDLEQLLVKYDCKNFRIKTQGKKRYAFADFATLEEADHCISEMDQTEFQGRNLMVRYGTRHGSRQSDLKPKETDNEGGFHWPIPDSNIGNQMLTDNDKTGEVLQSSGEEAMLFVEKLVKEFYDGTKSPVIVLNDYCLKSGVQVFFKSADTGTGMVRMQCYIAGKYYGQGIGNTKKDAKFVTARTAFKAIVRELYSEAGLPLPMYFGTLINCENSRIDYPQTVQPQKRLSKKKRKRYKNRDINIQTVQDSAQQELTRPKKSKLELGQFPRAQQPVVTEKQNTNKKKKTESDEQMKTEVTVTVSGIKGDTSSNTTEEFKPYEYSTAAQKLTEGGTTKKKDDYDPESQMMKKGKKRKKRKHAKKKRKTGLSD